MPSVSEAELPNPLEADILQNGKGNVGGLGAWLCETYNESFEGLLSCTHALPLSFSQLSLQVSHDPL